MLSDNPDGAENQQERLISTGWVIGFVDGEGCFSTGFNRQSDREGRSGYKTRLPGEFVRCVELVSAGRHLDSEGLIEIVEISQTMNRQNPDTI